MLSYRIARLRRIEVVVHRLDEPLAGGARVVGGVRVGIGGGGERLPEAGGGAAPPLAPNAALR